MLTVLTCRKHLECSCDRRSERSERAGQSSSEKRSESKPSDKSPSSGYSSQDSNTEDNSRPGTEALLIDLSSPGREDTWGDIRILDTDGEAEVEDKIRDLSFTDIALRRTGVALLSQLPQHAADLQIDSFVPAELTEPSERSQQGQRSHCDD